MISTALLFGLLLAAAATDLLRHKIYNWTTYPGIIIALLLNLCGMAIERGWLLQLESSRLADVRAVVGWVGLGESLLGFFACGFILVICFVFFDVGGGDVKLLAMIGAFLGIYEGIEVLLWSFVLGGAFALITLLWRHGAWNLMRALCQRLGLVLRVGSLQPLAETKPPGEGEQPAALYLAPSALAALIVVKFINLNVM